MNGDHEPHRNDSGRTSSGHDASGPGEPTVAAGLEHLQSAANEMIAAARTFLNVVEDVVTDREKLQAVTSGVGDLLAQATDALSSLANRATTSEPPSTDPSPRPRVRKIDVE